MKILNIVVVGVCIYILYFIGVIIDYHLFLYKASGWSVYNSSIGKYRLAYPSDWIINDCGGGDIVLSSERLEKCYYPSDAPENYLQMVYMQVVIYKNKDSWKGVSQALPNQTNLLGEWRTIAWIEREKFFPNFSFGLFPYTPIGIPDAPLRGPLDKMQEQDVRTSSYRFYLLYTSKPTYQETHRKVINSVRFF